MSFFNFEILVVFLNFLGPSELKAQRQTIAKIFLKKREKHLWRSVNFSIGLIHHKRSKTEQNLMSSFKSFQTTKGLRRF